MQDQGHLAIDAAFSQIEQIQQLMSFHQPDSELSVLNRSAFQHPIQVHPLTYAVLRRAQRLFDVSGGLFDSTVADALVNWEILPAHLSHIPNAVTQAQVQLLSNRHVYYQKPLLLDLGGIAKGFAVDLAIHVLKQHGVSNAVVNAGGDLRVLGHQPEPISIRNPQDIQQLLSVGELSAGAFATSGSYYSKQLHQGKIVSALVNPFDRQAMITPSSYSVIAPTAWLADGLTKVLTISRDAKHPCLRYFGATGIIID